MNKLLSLVVLVLALCGVGTVAQADEGQGYWSYAPSISTTSACVATSTASSTCMLFPAGTVALHEEKMVEVVAGGASRCCWSGKTGLDIAASGVLSDAAGVNGSGTCAGFAFGAAGNSVHDRPSRALVEYATLAGYRKGLCSTSVKRGGDSAYAPCTIDSDCTSFGGGTCVASPSLAQKQAAGMYLICESDSGSIKFAVRKYLRK